MSINKENDDDYSDDQAIIITDHLIIRDVDTGEILVNQKGSIKIIQDNQNGI